MMQTIHATAVAIEDHGVLLCGPSGVGKSDLALRLIDSGAVLVADDRVELRCDMDVLMVHCPAAIGGKLEVRGIGILTLPYVSPVTIEMIVSLVPPEAIERLPVFESMVLLGKSVRKLALTPFEASAPAKLRSAVNSAIRKSGS